MKNPQVKKGDRIVLMSGNNGNSSCNNEAGTVTTVNKNYFGCAFDNGVTYTIYYGTGGYKGDEFIPESREIKAKFLKDKNKKMAAEIAANEKEIEFLEKYKTEEEFVAAKLDAILTAHSEGKTEKVRVKAITEVLKELKISNLL